MNRRNFFQRMAAILAATGVSRLWAKTAKTVPVKAKTGTARVVLVRDCSSVTSLQVLDDWDTSARATVMPTRPMG